ncbi:hypothetical protein BGP79_03775 [Tersicoccus sp. Bi-70]|nr:hypothetical protein BGP79_03775 [Tersicoccus sp. Bi-70]
MTGCAGGATSTGDHSGHQMSGMTSSATPSPSGTGSAAAADAHNNADVMFAQMMLPHHEQAVQLSDIVLAKTGMKAEITALAKRIKAAQTPEIATMTSWLSAWNAPTTASMDHGMSGMVSAADVTALRDADGATAGTLFLTQMIGHHEGAVAMAKDQVTSGQNREAVALAQRVITSQSAEITEMKALQQAS